MHASTAQPDGQRAAQNPIRVDILAEWAGRRCMAPEDAGQKRQGTPRLRRHRPAQEARPAVPPRARAETHHPDVVPTVGQRPKRVREYDTPDDGNTLKCPWCAKKHAAHAWLRKPMLQKHPEKQLSSGAKEAQEAPDSDGETKQEEQEQRKFVCQQCHRVLKSATWLTRHKCEQALS
ncbi:hypothetical protein ERJ75_000897500 [Trypanosoma vivax]|nr:hypothetical protein ERJ75_000897500 [Trypanosoma vivax]